MFKLDTNDRMVIILALIWAVGYPIVYSYYGEKYTGYYDVALLAVIGVYWVRTAHTALKEDTKNVS